MRQGQVQSLFTLVYTGETPTCSPYKQQSCSLLAVYH